MGSEIKRPFRERYNVHYGLSIVDSLIAIALAFYGWILVAFLFVFFAHFRYVIGNHYLLGLDKIKPS